MRRRTWLGLAGAAVLGGCTSKGTGKGAAPSAAWSSARPVPPLADPPRVSVIATGLNVPWAVAFLPSHEALVTERATGRILRVPAAGGTPVEVHRIPDVAFDTSEGGLLGVAVS